VVGRGAGRGIGTALPTPDCSRPIFAGRPFPTFPPWLQCGQGEILHGDGLCRRKRPLVGILWAAIPGGGWCRDGLETVGRALPQGCLEGLGMDPGLLRWYRGGGQTVLRPNRILANPGFGPTVWRSQRLGRLLDVTARFVRGKWDEKDRACAGVIVSPSIFGADGVASGNAVRRMAFARWWTAPDGTVPSAGQARFLNRPRAPQGGFDRFRPDRMAEREHWRSRHFLRPESGVSSRFPWTSAGTVADQVEPSESPECPATRLGHGAGNGGREFSHPRGP
jgi:hypothetical protein